MRTHIKHRFHDFATLELEEHSGFFFVTYVTKELNPLFGEEGHEDAPKYAYFSNTSDKYDGYNEALKGFRERRDSANPFYPLQQVTYA